MINLKPFPFVFIMLFLLLSGCGTPAAQTPTQAPTAIPTQAPTIVPTTEPTVEPTPEPTVEPTVEPTSEPAPEIYSLGDTQIRETDGMLMVYVPGGEFEMGWMGGGDTRRMPIHTVALDGFWLDQTEVTNAQYEGCVAAGQCEVSRNAEHEWLTGADQPVVGVSWFDAQAYCTWAGGVLPTEAQWEYAARGPENLRYPWGEAEPDCELANFGAWEGCVGSTAPVGSFPDGVSWCGALDLAGNVYEWAANWDYEYTSERVVNPVGAESGTRKMMRGGSWTDFGQNLLAAQRMRFIPTDTADTVGFRCIAMP